MCTQEIMRLSSTSIGCAFIKRHIRCSLIGWYNNCEFYMSPCTLSMSIDQAIDEFQLGWMTAKFDRKNGLELICFWNILRHLLFRRYAYKRAEKSGSMARCDVLIDVVFFIVAFAFVPFWLYNVYSSRYVNITKYVLYEQVHQIYWKIN